MSGGGFVAGLDDEDEDEVVLVVTVLDLVLCLVID